MYSVTKRLDLGLSTSYRNWRTDTHCKFWHGHNLVFDFTFVAEELDYAGWVINFGDFAPIKTYLRDMYDHTMLVAEDDPLYSKIIELEAGDAADVRAIKNVSCEYFAEDTFVFTADWLQKYRKENPSCRARLLRVRVEENDNNSASYERSDVAADRNVLQRLWGRVAFADE